MRIACIHIPQFALQCATRLDPSLRGAAVAVVSGVEPGRERSGVLHAPVVLACSRAAWALGVRLGMTAMTARTQGKDGEIAIVTADAAAEREATRAIADAVLALAPTVDVGGRVGAGGAHLAMYCEVPSKTRGNAFGDKLVELLTELGLAARVGIADDRFTAWVAAAYGPANAKPSEAHEEGAVISVPRGGSPAFLSPRPLSLLAIPPEVQHMLESLGVTTLGEFASLPAPSVARPFEADYQALARGESGASLRPYHPEAAIREEIVVSASTVLELPGSLSGPAAIAQLSRRLALRLAGRGRGAARLEVSMVAASGEVREVPVTIDGAMVDAEEIARVLAPVLDTAQEDMPQLASQGGWLLRVVVTGEALVGGEAVEILDEATAPVRVFEVPPSLFAEGSTSVRVAETARGTGHGTDHGRVAGHATDHGRSRDRAHAAGVPHPMLPLEQPPRMIEQSSRFDQSPQIDQSSRMNDPSSRMIDHTPRMIEQQAPRMIDQPRMHEQPPRMPTQVANANEADPLAIVLSSSGSLFALSSPTTSGFGERREAHRRTRRGKQRRSRPTPSVQPRLFDRSSSK